MADTKRAVFKVHIKGSINDVWRELTKTDEVQKAMFNCRMDADLRPGGKLRMRSGNGKYTSVAGEITAYDPPRRFAHTFQFTNLDDPPSKVIYELEEAQGGVDFTLTCENIPAGTKTEKYMLSGGQMIVDTLKAMVETGKPPMKIRMMHVMMGLMAFTTPKRCLSTNWQ